MNNLATIVVKNFRDNFEGTPHLYFSPGRINLIGEHIDYNDGFVMPAAIDKGIYYAILANGTDKINLVATDFNEHMTLGMDEIKVSEGWRNYVLSVVNEFIKGGNKIGGFDCVFSGDIPRGSGMSSSAAVEGGLAYAINEQFKVGLNRVELALLCQRAEHNFPNVQCGIMDQFANMMGKKDHVILLDCKKMDHQYFPLQLDGYRLVLINTNVHHSLATGEYNVRRHRCETGLAVLKKERAKQSFRDVTHEDLAAVKDQLNEKVYNCCLFVIEEIERTQKAAALLQQNDVAAFGKLMYEAHAGLSKLYEVSCEELDFLVDYTDKFSSVIGARMMGGGFGGCTINIIKENEVDDFVTATVKDYQAKFDILPEAYIVKTWDGTLEIPIEH